MSTRLHHHRLCVTYTFWVIGNYLPAFIRQFKSKMPTESDVSLLDCDLHCDLNVPAFVTPQHYRFENLICKGSTVLDLTQHYGDEVVLHRDLFLTYHCQP